MCPTLKQIYELLNCPSIVNKKGRLSPHPQKTYRQAYAHCLLSQGQRIWGVPCNGLVQNFCNFLDFTLQFRLFCSNPSISVIDVFLVMPNWLVSLPKLGAHHLDSTQCNWGDCVVPDARCVCIMCCRTGDLTRWPPHLADISRCYNHVSESGLLRHMDANPKDVSPNPQSVINHRWFPLQQRPNSWLITQMKLWATSITGALC